MGTDLPVDPENAPEVVAAPGTLETAPAKSPAEKAQIAVLKSSQPAIEAINELAKKVFSTRGGRVGSGLGLLLEALWGFHVNGPLSGFGFEIAWRATHDYNDFACLELNADWDPEDPDTELLRVEAKSMNLGADESKGHFDEIQPAIGDHDLLLVLLWRWVDLDAKRVAPVVSDFFVGSARRVATLRDELHLERGGWFVDPSDCPDGCSPNDCPHAGEPINAAGVRERKSGPEAASPSTGKTQFQANFGGLVRMLKTRTPEARSRLRELRSDDEVAHQYISFIHRNLPAEERNAFLTAEWREALTSLTGNDADGFSSDECQNMLREAFPDFNYMEWLRDNLS